MLDPETVAVDAVLAALRDVLVAECATEVEFELSSARPKRSCWARAAARRAGAQPIARGADCCWPPEFAAGAVGLTYAPRRVRDAGHAAPRLGEGAGAVVGLVEGVADAPRPRDDVPVALERALAVDGAGRPRRARGAARRACALG